MGPQVLESLPLMNCSDDFVFDNQMIVQALYFGFTLAKFLSDEIFRRSVLDQFPAQRHLRIWRAEEFDRV